MPLAETDPPTPDGATSAERRPERAARAARAERPVDGLPDATVRGLIDGGWEIVTLADATGTIHYVSGAITTIQGWTPEEYRVNYQELVHPDDIPSSAVILGALLADPSGPAVVVNRVRHRDGRYLWMETLLENRLGDPALHAIVGYTRDVHDRVLAEQAAARRLAGQEALHAASAVLLGMEPSELEHGVHRALGLVASALGIDALVFNVVAGIPEDPQFRARFKWRDDARLPSFVPLPTPRPWPWLAQVLLAGEVMRIDDLMAGPVPMRAERHALVELGPRATLALPILASHGEHAFVAAHCAEPKAWTDEEQATLASLGPLLLSAWQRVQAEHRLIDQALELRRLNAHLEALRDSERAAVATELHEDHAQVLAVILSELHQLEALLGDGTGGAEAGRLVTTTSQLLGAMEATAATLASSVVADLGLAAGIRSTLRTLDAGTVLVVSTDITDALPHLPTATAVALYRITQDALGAIARDPAARRLLVRLDADTPGHVTLQIRCDGSALADPGALGTAAMREAARRVGAAFTHVAEPADESVPAGGVPGRHVVTTLTVRVATAPAASGTLAPGVAAGIEAGAGR